MSPLATANADSYAASYSATVTANPTTAAVSPDAMLVKLFPQEPIRVLPQEPTRMFPLDPTRALRPVIGLWG